MSQPEDKWRTRNVIDHYEYWTTDAIKADLDSKRNDFRILISNKFHDFNIGTVIRCSNAFLGKEVLIYGPSKTWDRRGTVGAHLYENLKHIKHIDELDFQGQKVIGIDNLPGSVPIETFEWPDEPFVMAFGQEQVGLPEEILDVCDNLVYISQYGSVRSLNVGVAAGIAMYDYCSKKKLYNNAR